MSRPGEARVVAEFESAKKTGCGKRRRPITSPSYFRKCLCGEGRNLAFYLPGKFFLGIATKFLTSLASIHYRSCIMAAPQVHHVIQRMQKALDEESSRLDTLNDELVTLQPSYDRFLEVARQMERKQDLANKLRVALAKKRDIGSQEKESYPLWEMIAVYLRFVNRARVSEIADYLDWIEFTNNRQAIESAINTHREHVFHVDKNGREKFISLEGESDAATTKRSKRKH